MNDFFVILIKSYFDFRYYRVKTKKLYLTLRKKKRNAIFYRTLRLQLLQLLYHFRHEKEQNQLKSHSLCKFR